ncbi:MAG: 50S ribosomal protein L23, partial [Elusimicrobiota bacterium]
YSFEVKRACAKGDIARSVEALFNVRVLKVRTVTVKGKLRRMGRTQGYLSDWKKAIVTIARDQKIDFEKAI